MDSTHVVLLVHLGFIIAIDEAIDAATYLALKDLRERFERRGK